MITFVKYPLSKKQMALKIIKPRMGTLFAFAVVKYCLQNYQIHEGLDLRNRPKKFVEVSSELT